MQKERNIQIYSWRIQRGNGVYNWRIQIANGAGCNGAGLNWENEIMGALNAITQKGVREEACIWGRADGTLELIKWREWK